MRHWLGAIATLAIALPLASSAEAKVYRIQARPLHPLWGGAALQPDLTPDPPPALEMPGWLDWAMRLMDGRAFTFAQPSWDGTLAGARWWVGLEAGLKGRMDLGYGPAVVFNGRLDGPWGHMQNSSTVLASGGGVSWLSEVTFGRAPWTLQLRAWNGPGASSVGQSATLSLRQAF